MRFPRLFSSGRPAYHTMVAEAYAATRATPIVTRPHGLPLPVIVSLTSYPPRYPTLIYSLQALLLQETRPDGIHLYIARTNFDRLPRAVLDLQDDGLAIFKTDDLGPYNKYVPARIAHPDAIIVTADDDIYFRPTWLGDLISEWVATDRTVLAHRAHRLAIGPGGLPLAFREWQREISDTSPSWDVQPTSGAGTLYPPGPSHPDLLRPELFMSLCPGTDDIWLYWMTLLSGACARKVGPVHGLIMWSGSQRHALWRTNFAGGNDRAVAAMVKAYGSPRDISLASASSD